MENKLFDFDKIEKQDVPIYIDMRLMRNAIKEFRETGFNVTVNDLMKLAIEKRIILQDSEDK